MAGLWASPRSPARDRALPEREERPGACSCPQGKHPLPLPWEPSREPPIWKENQEPKKHGPGQGERGWGRGSRQRAGSEPAVRLCFSRWPRGRGWGGCQPRLEVPLEPFPEWLWGPPHQQPGAGGRGERHSPAGSCQGPSLAGRWPSPLRDRRCASTGQLPALPAWTPKPRGNWGGKRILR